MSTRRLAPVHFYMGQTLLPEHLIAQEEAGRAALDLRMQALGLPAYGVTQLVLSEPLLREGVFALSALSAILIDGSMIDVPATCQVAPFSLNATGQSQLSLYLHTLHEPVTERDNPVYRSDPRAVGRVVYRAQLAMVDTLPGTRSVLRICDLEKGVDGVWSIAASYMPPLATLGESPFLRAELPQIDEALRVIATHIEGQLQDTFLRPERLAVMRRTLSDLLRVQALLQDMRSGLQPHPYTLFVALRELLWALACFHEALPEDREHVYRHEHLAGCFSKLITQLKQLCRPVYAHITHLRFTKGNGLFTIAALPEDLKLAQEVYLLIQRPHVHDRIALDEVKLSCTSRLALVHRLVLKGVTYQPVERPTFRHPFGPEVDFYQIGVGEEWNHCIKEGSISFYVHPVLERANAFLFWR